MATGLFMAFFFLVAPALIGATVPRGARLGVAAIAGAVCALMMYGLNPHDLSVPAMVFSGTLALGAATRMIMDRLDRTLMPLFLLVGVLGGVGAALIISRFDSQDGQSDLAFELAFYSMMLVAALVVASTASWFASRKTRTVREATSHG